MAAARFITLEGGEGSGKSTQAKRLADWLESQGHATVLTREPGGTPGAEDIRKLLVSGEPGRWDALTEALLHYAARRDHVERSIRPALTRGAWVISDRFADSTLAYQGYGQGLGAAPIAALNRLVLGDFAPGLTLLFDLPVEAGLARAAARRGNETRYEGMGREFHARVREGFLAAARAEPGRFAVIDAAPDPDTIERAVRKAVAARFPGQVRP